MPDQLLTVQEVADRLRVDPKTVYRWVWAGEIPHRRLGPREKTIRVSERDLESYLAGRRGGAVA